MADFPAQPNQTNPSQSSKVSSREYLEQLRARRTNRQQPEPPPVAPVQTTQAVQPQPIQETQVAQPQPVQQPSSAPVSPVTQVAPVAPVAESEIFPGQYKPIPEETVVEWKASSRPFKKRNRQFYTTVGLITILISAILFLAGQFLPIAVVIAVAFLGYVLSSVPPETIINKITTYGIRSDTDLYYWEELGRFWFETRYDQKMVHIETARFPGRIALLLENIPEQEMEEILSEVLLKQKPVDTFIDIATRWLQEKIPLES